VVRGTLSKPMILGMGRSQNIQTQTIVVFIELNLKPHPKPEIGSVWRPWIPTNKCFAFPTVP